MINTILTFDNNDFDLGEFFERCATLTKESADADFNIVEINSQSLNELNFQLRAESVNGNSFLFISYTHGSESELLKSGITPFISESINVSCLKNSLSYCFACYAGKKLGQSLINNGAIAFIGFTDELKIQRYFNAFDNFIDCATSGILFFFRGDNLENSIIKMKNKYTDYIDQYYLKDMLIASWFMEHRDALVLLGNSDLTIADFNYN
ncbi:MAG: hypothetical protein AB7S72_10635 [Draconibacterium sp.]